MTGEPEDVVQDILVKLWAKKNSLDSVKNLEAYTMTVTRNHCLDNIRTRKWTTGVDHHPERPEDAPDPYRRAEAGNTAGHVLSFIDRLPEQQKMVIHLRDVEEMEYDEIGRIMEMEVNNVRVTLSRARRKVREEIEKIENYEYSGN